MNEQTKKQDRYTNSASGGEGLVQQPFVVEKLSVMIAELNGLKCFPESFDTFKKKWEPSAQRKATGSGRATKAIVDKEGLQRHIISRVECVLESNQQLLARAAAQPNFKQRLQEAMFFAFSKDMRSCGPEYNLLGSMKLTFSGGHHVTNTHTHKQNQHTKENNRDNQNRQSPRHHRCIRCREEGGGKLLPRGHSCQFVAGQRFLVLCWRLARHSAQQIRRHLARDGRPGDHPLRPSGLSCRRADNQRRGHLRVEVHGASTPRRNISTGMGFDDAERSARRCWHTSSAELHVCGGDRGCDQRRRRQI